jgi:methionine aminopeptidase
VNEVVVHGVPDSRPLAEGDIVNVDVTVYLGGVHADTSATFPVGKRISSTGKWNHCGKASCNDAVVCVQRVLLDVQQLPRMQLAIVCILHTIRALALLCHQEVQA